MRLISEKQMGALSYRRRPWTGRAWGGPMNGQGWRCRLVAELVLKTNPTAIVETGTYLGTTTEWLAAFQIPVFSCEASERNFGFARQRLVEVRNATVVLGDSRTGLRQILAGPLKEVTAETILFYLDAHWNEDLPLAEELEIIFTTCPRAVVLVDDFAVPGEPGYAFDDYGKGKALTADYAEANILAHGLLTFYPRRPAKEETGARRGCAVFGKADTVGNTLQSVSLLRRAEADAGDVA